MSLEGKNVVVTGASGGMGRILCKRLKDAGANLAVCSNDKEGLCTLTSEIGGAAVASVTDITDETDVSNFFAEINNKMGAPYCLVNLAGLSIPTNYKEIEERDFDTMINVNVKGSMLSSKYFARSADNNALIINIGSMAARNTNANAPVYCIAKAAVNKLSEGLLLQLGKQGIRVTTVNPGGTDTPFWGERKVDRTKLMSPKDVADIIYFIMNTPENIQIHSIDFESFAKYNN